MSEENKAREFWLKIPHIERVGIGGFRDAEISINKECTRNFDDFKNAIHVIEYSAYEQAQDKIKHLEERVEKLLEALEFYGDREETRESFDQLDWDLVNNNAALQDRGKRARAALKEDEEMR